MMKRLTRTFVLSASVLAAPIVLGAAPAGSADVAGRRAVRQVTIPAGTILHVRLGRGVGSDISRVEEAVPATLDRPVVIDGRTVLRTGSAASGYVAEATRSGKVKGRGRLALRFTRLTPAGGSASYKMATRSWVAVAPATKQKDALTIGVPAAGGAAIGALAGGKKGAGIGALVGGGGGTAVVLGTRGKEVRVARGASIRVRLAEPLTIAVDEAR